MKKLTNKFLAVILITAGVSSSYAQVRIVNSNANSAAANSSAFIDASSNITVNNSSNVGKGLLFPRTDLTTFTAFGFTSTTGIPNNYPTFFDGLIVYNTAASGVAGVGSTQGTLTQGYWFYENKSGTLNGGTWKPVTAVTAKENILTTETITNRQINSAQIYAIKGSFAASGSSTAPTSYTNAVIIPPTGSLYRITIYQTGTNNVYANSVYSYDKTNGNFITGSPSMSVVYPNGNYDYVVEYTK
ncbi:hypothetical protein [Chryseobacterium viscerum]|uniref:Uncharacterized protein n=1 Tax=Chryseobacterium viscerum TaxID=1037377 RepID=A0A316WKG3_9FLAO|nr:hypothetical protein [Chryseobacterium viscerum]PWN61874.1 hypothetical protein C1634_011465 [Chryseobacterium viscerum]